MVYYLVAVLYVLACFLLLLVVMLQQGKGGDMASAFGGGGSQTAFGARAGATVLTKATAILGTLFMLGALAVGIIGRGGSSSIMSGVGAPAQQTSPAPAAPQQSTPQQSTPQQAAPQAPASGGQPPSAPVEQPKK
jgi:preprotein translocase subunit SecG